MCVLPRQRLRIAVDVVCSAGSSATDGPCLGDPSSRRGTLTESHSGFHRGIHQSRGSSVAVAVAVAAVVAAAAGKAGAAIALGLGAGSAVVRVAAHIAVVQEAAHSVVVERHSHLAEVGSVVAAVGVREGMWVVEGRTGRLAEAHSTAAGPVGLAVEGSSSRPVVECLDIPTYSSLRS